VKITTTYLSPRVALFGGTYSDQRARELESLVRMYNRFIGPVTSLNLFRPEASDFSQFAASSRHVPITRLLQDLTIKARPHSRHLPGGGKGATPLAAMMGALGEMAERLLAVLDSSRLEAGIRYGSFRDLSHQGLNALEPNQFRPFAQEQYLAEGFAYAPVDEDTFMGWVRGQRLLTGAEIWVPAQLVLMYYKSHSKEPAIGYATTAGLAFHISRELALLHGLYEVIERDAVNIWWYCRLSPPAVDVDLADLIKRRFNIRAARLTTSTVDTPRVFLNRLDTPLPVFTVFAVDTQRQERAFFGGSGAAADRDAALAQALFEVGQCQTAFRFEDPFGRNPIYPDTDLSEVVEFFDAPLYYGHRRNLQKIAWYSKNPAVISGEDVPSFSFHTEAEELEWARGWLGQSDLDPIIFDLDGACWPGAYVTKVYVPELTQACPPGNPPLGHPRFYELPERLGLLQRRLVFDDLNPDPIPLA
jgi:ribosomal protein S12 methylthiotransferase accessory factor